VVYINPRAVPRREFTCPMKAEEQGHPVSSSVSDLPTIDVRTD
jgi:hypothetical protein